MNYLLTYNQRSSVKGKMEVPLHGLVKVLDLETLVNHHLK